MKESDSVPEWLEIADGLDARDVQQCAWLLGHEENFLAVFDRVGHQGDVVEAVGAEVAGEGDIDLCISNTFLCDWEPRPFAAVTATAHLHQTRAVSAKHHL